MASEALWVGISCLITLTVTFIFNWITSSPKRKKQEKEEAERKHQAELDAQRKQREKELADVQELVTHCRQSIEEKIKYQTDKVESQRVAIVKRLDSQTKDIKFVMTGLQSQLKYQLKVRYTEWIEKGYAPIDTKEDLEKIYQAYHNLGANGVMDKLRDEFMNLPEKPKGDK